MRTYPRSERVRYRIKEELANLLLKDIKDPRLDMVTITHVKVSNDLRNARVYYCLSGDEDRLRAAKEGFAKAAGFVKRELASRLGLRYMPNFTFFYDDTFDYGAKIDQLLQKI